MAMAEKIRKWTLRELHRLPDDGNKYELVRGELFVTPTPSVGHQELASLLTRRLDPYVARENLGRIYRPRAVIRVLGSEVEPDLMVRPVPANVLADWDEFPLPLLVVEILSGSTRRRDREQKRALYMDAGIPEYWMLDAETRSIVVVRPGMEPEVRTTTLTWHPPGSANAFVLDVVSLFREALGET